MRLKERDRGEVYDRLVRLADKILTKNSACSACPIGCSKQLYTRSWCCSRCPRLGPNGCTVQALACKLWLCSMESYKQNRVMLSRLWRLRQIAEHYKIYVGRAGKVESLYYGELGITWCPSARS